MFWSRKQDEPKIADDLDVSADEQRNPEGIESRKMLVDLAWLGHTLGYLAELGMGSEDLVGLVEAIAIDGELPEGSNLIGPAVDRWRGEIIRACSLQVGTWRAAPHLAHDYMTHAIRGFYEGPEKFYKQWYQRAEARSLGEQTYRKTGSSADSNMRSDKA